ncbi:hypothetical protein [Terrisporobacter sp.]|uniref:hypothetical protein n=1 Tax=Terrisporobacter sp. TaxID=1965305 RepID=UPI0028A271BF|nr:hypothetical protein [Terrisporobacter sp.]
MYRWKINMVDGKSYVVESKIGKADDFINDLFSLNLNPQPKSSMVAYKLFDPKGETTQVLIISNHVSSVEWY